MSAIELICRDEPMMLDPECLAALYLEMGERRAEQAVAQAQKDLSYLADTAFDVYRDGGFDALAGCADQIERIAEPLGFATVARVASDLIDLCDSRDFTGMSSVLMRLRRVSHQSARLLWRLGDLSG